MTEQDRWPDPASLGIDELKDFTDKAYFHFCTTPADKRRKAWDRVAAYRDELYARRDKHGRHK